MPFFCSNGALLRREVRWVRDGRTVAHRQSLGPERSATSSKLARFLQESIHECMRQVMPVKPDDLSFFQRTRKPGT